MIVQSQVGAELCMHLLHTGCSQSTWKPAGDNRACKLNYSYVAQTVLIGAMHTSGHQLWVCKPLECHTHPKVVFWRKYVDRIHVVQKKCVGQSAGHVNLFLHCLSGLDKASFMRTKQIHVQHSYHDAATWTLWLVDRILTTLLGDPSKLFLKN